MKRTAVLLLVSLVVVIAWYPSVNANDSGVITDQQSVTISIATKGLQVIESIKLTNKGSENATVLRFWIQQNAQDTKIIDLQSGKELVPEISGNIRTCSLEAENLSLQPNRTRTLEITYFLPTTEQNFIKTLLYNTTSFSVTYREGSNQWTLFQGEYLLYGVNVNNALQIRVNKPTEAPLNIIMIIVVFVVVLLVLSSLLLLFRKHRRKTKKTLIETEETLATKKTLLLSLLKDLEKQYRSRSISDETYTKIKEEYKRQTVDAMKQLDDLKK